MHEQKLIDWHPLLLAFTGSDPLRPAMMQPNTTEGYVWASDATAMIRVPQSLMTREYLSHAKVPNVREVWANTRAKEPSVSIQSQRLLDVMQAIVKVPATSPCPECLGEGDIECPCCGHSDKCSECNGTGYVDNHTLPEVYPFDDQHIRIGEAVFSPDVVAKLEAVVLALGESSFEWIGGYEAHHQYVFRVGPAEVYLMGMRDKKPLYTLI